MSNKMLIYFIMMLFLSINTLGLFGVTNYTQLSYNNISGTFVDFDNGFDLNLASMATTTAQGVFTSNFTKDNNSYSFTRIVAVDRTVGSSANPIFRTEVLPKNCADQNPLQFRGELNRSPSTTTRHYCYDGTDWSLLSTMNYADDEHWEGGVTYNYLYNISELNYTGYKEFGSYNYSRVLSYSGIFGCYPNHIVNIDLYINGISNKTTTIICDEFNETFSGTYIHGSEDIFNTSFYFNSTNATQDNDYYFNKTFFQDLYNPNAILNLTVPRNFVSADINITSLCEDSQITTLQYNLTYNDINYILKNETNGTEIINNTLASDNTNTFILECSDLFGSTKITNISTIYVKNIILIDEKLNTPFDISNLTNVKAYFDDNSSFHDFKANNNASINFTSPIADKIRFELEYSDGTLITRYVDISLVDDDLRVCANTDGTTHYEQLITSAVKRKVKLINVFANCTVASDYTRFAYQTSNILRAYTINANYNLITYDNNDLQVTLASVDGSLASYINVDNLEFQQTAYNFDILGDAISFQLTDTDEISILYYNIDNDNTAVTATITRTDTNVKVFESSSFDNPNNFTIIYNFATQTDINETTLFKINIEKTNNEGTSSLSKYFNTKAKTGTINSLVAFVLSLFLLLFGLTFTTAQNTFSYFGIFITIASIVILTLAVPTWYILFMQVVSVIVLIYIIIILNGQNQNTLSG